MNQGQPVGTEFAPAQDGGETTSAEGILVAAYMVLWLLLMVFIGVTYRRQRATASRLDEIERGLALRDDAKR